MPIMTLLPEDDALVHPDWTANGETELWQCLVDNNDDISYAECSVDQRRFLILYTDPSVSEGDIDTIDSVTFISSGRCPSRGSGGSDLIIRFQTPSGHDETFNYFNNANYESESGIIRETKPDGSDWEYSDIEGITTRCQKVGTATVRLSYLALKVTYTEAVSADNATFFGANF